MKKKVQSFSLVEVLVAMAILTGTFAIGMVTLSNMITTSYQNDRIQQHLELELARANFIEHPEVIPTALKLNQHHEHAGIQVISQEGRKQHDKIEFYVYRKD